MRRHSGRGELIMRASIAAFFALLVGFAMIGATGGARADVVQYVRYLHAGAVGFGIVDGATVRVLDGNFLEAHAETGKTLALADLTLLPPTVPSKVLAVGLNYASHAASSSAGNPPLFAKLPSSLVGHGGAIILPPDSSSRLLKNSSHLALYRDSFGLKTEGG